MGRDEQNILEDFISQNNLKVTRQRRAVLKTFLSSKDHVSAEELYRAITKEDPKIGLATVYRTLSLLTQSGLAVELDFGDGQKRYEQNLPNRHHDHMICSKCNGIIEFNHPLIEKFQEEVAKSHEFKITHHKLDMFGICSKCQKDKT